MKTPVTIKSLMEELLAEREVATAIRYLITKQNEIPELFSCYGWLNKNIPAMAEHKLRLFETTLRDIWQGPTAIPRGTTYEVLRAADLLLNTCGIESIRTEEGDMDYCNCGDSYGATLCHYDGRFFIWTWADFMEECERKGIRIKENWED